MFVGPHIHVDCIVKNIKGLTDTHIVQDLLEDLARNTDMVLAFPPIACDFPFAQSELENFVKELEDDGVSATALKKMKALLKRRQEEDSGVTAISVWTTSHCAIHTWPESNYFALDAFSCKKFNPNDILDVLKLYFDIEVMHVNLMERFKNRTPVMLFEGSLTTEDNIPQAIVDGMLDAEE